MRRYWQRVFVRLHSPGKRSAGILRGQWRRAPVGSLFVLSLLLVSLFASGAAGQAAPSESPRITVRGTVVNSVTHEPVARALVYSPDNRFATLTDDQGRFEFVISPEAAAPPPDQHDISAVETESYSGPLRSFTNFPVVLIARKPGFLESHASPADLAAFSRGPGQGRHDRARARGSGCRPGDFAEFQCFGPDNRASLPAPNSRRTRPLDAGWISGGPIERRVSILGARSGHLQVAYGRINGSRSADVRSSRADVRISARLFSECHGLSNCRRDPIDCRSDFPS